MITKVFFKNVFEKTIVSSNVKIKVFALLIDFNGFHCLYEEKILSLLAKTNP